MCALKFLKLLGLLSMASILCGCFSTGMLQTAQPTSKEKGKVTGGYNVIPFGFEMMYRRGVADRSDIGFTYCFGFWGHARLDYKYALWISKNENAYLSTGLGADAHSNSEYLGYFYQNKFSTPLIGASVPLYFSFNHLGNWTPYMSQRLSVDLRNIGIAGVYNDLTPSRIYRYDHLMIYSGCAGVKWSRSFKNTYFFEISYSFRTTHSYHSLFNQRTNTFSLYRDKSTIFLPQFTVGMLLQPRAGYSGRLNKFRGRKIGR